MSSDEAAAAKRRAKNKKKKNAQKKKKQQQAQQAPAAAAKGSEVDPAEADRRFSRVLDALSKGKHDDIDLVDLSGCRIGDKKLRRLISAIEQSGDECPVLVLNLEVRGPRA